MYGLEDIDACTVMVNTSVRSRCLTAQLWLHGGRRGSIDVTLQWLLFRRPEGYSRPVSSGRRSTLYFVFSLPPESVSCTTTSTHDVFVRDAIEASAKACAGASTGTRAGAGLVMHFAEEVLARAQPGVEILDLVLTR